MKTLRRKNIKPKKFKNKTKRRYKKYLGGGPKKNMKNLIILLFQLTHTDISKNTELLDQLSLVLDKLNNDLESGNVERIKEGIILLKNKPQKSINNEKYLLLTSIYQLLIRKYDDDNTSLLKKVEECENKEFDRISPQQPIQSKPLHHIRFSSVKSQEGVEPKSNEFDI